MPSSDAGRPGLAPSLTLRALIVNVLRVIVNEQRDRRGSGIYVDANNRTAFGWVAL